MDIGTRVQLKFASKPTGTIFDKQVPLKINGVIFSPEKFKVKWDNEEDGESRWLKERDLQVIAT